MSHRLVVAVVTLLVGSAVAHAASLVAETEALTPAQQQKAFHLPPGFEIQLVAAEPNIQKPMNMNFDAAGRLWVTHSVEYPFPAKPASGGRDGVTILADFGPDGRARSVTRFADNLNIPIGLIPLSPTVALVHTNDDDSGKVVRLEDTDGDGKADKRTVILSGFGFEDTHGMTNSFTMWLDGYIYATHGFRNQSHIKGADGRELKLTSGNVYRFRPDPGSTGLEQVTEGQVNPFGLTFDSWGHIFTADCHSRPLTMLIRGATYPHFGNPPPPLGHGPEMINHNHGSTGIAGIAWYEADHFPAEYRECLYVGNPVTGRVHRDSIKWHGATPEAVTHDDFITCDDPWFRPVDIQLGPDGALYIADFYNCIIGHYEVDLKHPRRDRERGRIWRVVYKGAPSPPGTISDSEATAREQTLALKALAEQPTLSTAEAELVRSRLKHEHAFVRAAAVEALMLHPHGEAIEPLLALWAKTPDRDTHLIHAIRLALREHLAQQGGFAHAAEIVRQHPDYAWRIADVAVAVSGSEAGAFVLTYLKSDANLPPQRMADLLRHAGRNSDGTRMTEINAFAMSQRNRPPHEQALILGALGDITAERGQAMPSEQREWAIALVRRELKADAEARQKRATELAAKLKLREVVVDLLKTAADRKAPERLPALKAAFDIDRDATMEMITAILHDPTELPGARQFAAERLAEANSGPAREQLVLALRTAPQNVATHIAIALASSKIGATALLNEVEAGRAAASLLQHRAVDNRLRRSGLSPEEQERLAKLTAKLPPADGKLNQQIAEAAAAFAAAQTEPQRGRAVFMQYCAVCHTYKNEGSALGPGLDGVGGRGTLRLLEDILDPNRNVDREFRLVMVQTKDGRSLSGIGGREEGSELILTDAARQQTRLPLADVTSRTEMPLSLMPPNFGDILPPQQLHDLLKYLMTP